MSLPGDEICRAGGRQESYAVVIADYCHYQPGFMQECEIDFDPGRHGYLILKGYTAEHEHMSLADDQVQSATLLHLLNRMNRLAGKRC